ncbi:nickel-dependent hydrogenase large subunit [Clostridium sp. JN-9]|uniref:nickel-dependent hydrogenase large subunit n=1 Tax=Clostridium sp. JN-9 TaxID=2507159 RepID=UPI000FFE1503|nr:nickel-dependent hydrogenase large subunit [Clostridium sp. JN-9]QAT40620.1 Ni/Fe hydrogenase [Clostridium sp. JN-9]
MKKIITIDPVTRVSGFLEITAETENNIVTNAKTSGLLFRGFEKMLKGRSPLDAVYFTERICGICSTSHAAASSLALEDALRIPVNINDLYIRDIMHGFEFLQNHLRQFYFFTMPDYAKLPNVSPISPEQYSDYRLPEHLNKDIEKNYIKNIEISRLAHEGLAVLGGKAPHNHGIFPGGVTVNIDAYKLEKVKSIISKIKEFVNNFMIQDMETISKYYEDYFHKGESYSNYMSFGLFNDYTDPEISYLKPSVLIHGKKQPFEMNKITENILYSWYISDKSAKSPGDEAVEEVDLNKENAYTFIKAPRYNGLPMEGGPLARLMITGEYTKGGSCMDRNAARVLETKKIIGIMEKLTERVELKKSSQGIYNIPESASGAGLIDTIRGPLGHWLKIENKVIKHYDIITPTGWNLSPQDENGVHGPAEKALIGTKLNSNENTPELGRIIRSFDPCISCATHIVRTQ